MRILVYRGYESIRSSFAEIENNSWLYKTTAFYEAHFKRSRSRSCLILPSSTHCTNADLVFEDWNCKENLFYSTFSTHPAKLRRIRWSKLWTVKIFSHHFVHHQVFDVLDISDARVINGTSSVMVNKEFWQTPWSGEMVQPVKQKLSCGGKPGENP